MIKWREQVEDDFVKNINDTYTLNLAISILEDREDFREEIERLHSIIKEVRETLLNYGETFDLKIHQQMQKRLLEILERANNDK